MITHVSRQQMWKALEKIGAQEFVRLVAGEFGARQIVAKRGCNILIWRADR